MLKFTIKKVRQIIVLVVGMTIIIIGLAMIALPGPATIVIPAGLAVLAIEFTWARKWLNRIKDGFGSIKDQYNSRNK